MAVGNISSQFRLFLAEKKIRSKEIENEKNREELENVLSKNAATEVNFRISEVIRLGAAKQSTEAKLKFFRNVETVIKPSAKQKAKAEISSGYSKKR